MLQFQIQEFIKLLPVNIWSKEVLDKYGELLEAAKAADLKPQYVYQSPPYYFPAPTYYPQYPNLPNYPQYPNSWPLVTCGPAIAQNT